MGEIAQDVRYAVRALRRSPAFSVVAVLTLALGIAANAAIFGAVNAVLLRPLPYADPDRLVMLWNSYRQPALSHAALSPADFAEIREQHRGFAAAAALADMSVNLTGSGDPERLQAFLVSPNFFEVLGVRPALGRGFAPEEGPEGRNFFVVLSDDLWRRRFGADSGVLGRAVRLNDRTYTVVGVAPRGMRFPDAASMLFPAKADLWIPFAWEGRRGDERGNQYLRMVARLAPGVTLDQARRDLAAIAADFRARFPETYRAESGWAPVLVAMPEQIVGDTRPALLVLLAAVGLVLLIACANVANLLLARTTARRQELAVRTALGAGRGRLVRQLLTESLVLAVAGGALGGLLAAWATRLIARFGPADVPRLAEAGVDGRVLLFTVGVTLLTGFLFGLAPAVQQRGVDPYGVLRTGTRSVAGGRQRAGRLLVAGQVALALVVLIASGLLVRSLARLQRVDPGFRADGVLTAKLTLPQTKYDSAAQVQRFYTALLARLATLPEVTGAGVTTNLPFSGDLWDGSFAVEGQPIGPGDPIPHAEYTAASPGYFAAMAIPLRDGRDFTDQDVRSAPRVVVVNEPLARRYWPRSRAVGKRLNLGGTLDTLWATVVGVVPYVHRSSLADDGRKPQIYVSFYRSPQHSASLVVRGADPLRLAPAVRAAVREVDPGQPVGTLQPMARLLAGATARQRFNTVLLGAFAAAALLLAAVGLYGVMSYLVVQRTGEIGVRMALGARPRDVLTLVVGQGMRVALGGLAAGLLAAYAASRLIAGLLFGVGAGDVATYVGAAGLLAAVALVATGVPAWRAARVDPVAALRAS